MAPRNPIPCTGYHRNVPLHDHQSPQRLEVVKQDIDDAYALMGRTAALCRFADTVSRAPEARAFAAACALANLRRDSDRRRRRKLDVDPESLEATIASLTSQTWRSESCYCTLMEERRPSAVKRATPLPPYAERVRE